VAQGTGHLLRFPRNETLVVYAGEPEASSHENALEFQPPKENVRQDRPAFGVAPPIQAAFPGKGALIGTLSPTHVTEAIAPAQCNTT
jgi:hypothetical protein